MIPVAVIGTGQSIFTLEPERACPGEASRTAAEEAIAQAGIGPSEVDAVVVACCPAIIDGTPELDLFIAPAVRAANRPVLSIGGGAVSGANALLAALYQVASGTFGTVLVVACQELSVGDDGEIIDEDRVREEAGAEIGPHCRQAERYLSARLRTVTVEHAAMVTVKNLLNSARNGYTPGRQGRTVAEVLASPAVQFPVSELEVAAICEGAAAAVVTGERSAQRASTMPAWIAGTGRGSTAFSGEVFDPAYPEAIVRAAQRAYQEAWIYDPTREIDLAEIQETTSWQELIAVETLGLCSPGEAGRMVEFGITALGGELPVNPSGGALSANPLCASGLVRQVEAARQVMGAAAEHQVAGASRAVACSISHQGSEAVVAVFSAERP